jgi:diaminohydroxyphosphoribosylaminopyrimidine deaminase/5-amino-6-(5-phosphoribosylamino)uracil reductase
MEKSSLGASIQETDFIHLRQALDLAKIREGFCSPNPSVGALLVDLENKVIATGYHLEAGALHAEVAVIQALTQEHQEQIDLIDKTLYVTLEPCCHWGKTPPCTDLIIKSGIKRVVYGYKDPNTMVAGKGALALQAAGIICDYLPLPEIELFYKPYHHWVTTQLPFVTAKIAMTLNGKIAGAQGKPIQITGKEIQKFTHDSRKISDAILTTSATILFDNPQLNVRYENETIAKPIYILDSELNISLSAKIFSTAKSVTIFYSKKHQSDKVALFGEKGARCIPVEQTSQGLSLPHILKCIGEDGIHHLWVEAGGTLFSALWREQLLQQAFFYIAPRWMSEGKTAFPSDFSLTLENQKVEWIPFNEDVLCKVLYPSQDSAKICLIL